MKFICPRCEHTAYKAAHMKYHMNRTRVCHPIAANIVLTEEIKAIVLMKGVYRIPETSSSGIVAETSSSGIVAETLSPDVVAEMAQVLPDESFHIEIKQLKSNVTQQSTVNVTDKPITKKKQRPYISLRREVWFKYIGIPAKAPCWCCNQNEISTFDFICGHVVAAHHGGGLTLDNLRPICSTCNTDMGTQNLLDFKKGLQTFRGSAATKNSVFTMTSWRGRRRSVTAPPFWKR